jgi:ribosomal protein S18 acetylase RimI-like enzyme
LPEELVLDSKDERKIKVRRARVSDLPELIKNFETIASEGKYLGTERVSDEQKERIRKRISDERALSAVVEVDGKLVGYVAVAQYGQLEKTKDVYELSMGIIEGYRSIGAGSALMTFTIEWAKERKARKLCLEVFSTNQRAIKLYEKFGFEIEGVRRKQFIIEGIFADEVQMALFF